MTLASTHAQRVGVTVHTACSDLDSEPVPAGPWDVIIDFYFLQRQLLPRMLDSLAVSGFLLWVHPTRANLQRHPRPSARFLLDDGEARQLIADLGRDDLRIIECHEGWQTNDRHESIVMLQRLSAATGPPIEVPS